MVAEATSKTRIISLNLKVSSSFSKKSRIFGAQNWGVALSHKIVRHSPEKRFLKKPIRSSREALSKLVREVKELLS